MSALLPFEPPASIYGSAAHNFVEFRHPAYSAAAPSLLILAATEDGLDFDLALASCCIVTGTPWEKGYLAVTGPDVSDFECVNRPLNGVLRGKRFFFYVKGEELSYKYPVIPSFHHWRFPHDDLPAPWRDICITNFVPTNVLSKGPVVARERDITCRMSGYADAVELAHIIPAVEKNWFTANNMSRYCRRPYDNFPVNDEQNILILRKDIHHLFDNRRLTFLPKRFGSGAPQLVSHAILPSGSPEFIGLYHNRSLQPIRGIAVEFLFARFAWSLFTDHLLKFFGSDIEYTVRLWDKLRAVPDIQTIKGSHIKAVTQLFESSQSQSRSISPSKRSRTTYSADEEEVVDYIDEDDDDDDDDDDEADEPPRGRTLKRRRDDLSADHCKPLPSFSHDSWNSTGKSCPQTPGTSPPAKRVSKGYLEMAPTHSSRCELE